jgi:ribonuclease HI
MNSPLKVFIDGASRGNPGPAALGTIAYTIDPNQPVFALGYSFYRYTNNVAEYGALVLALHEIIKLRWQGPIHIYADSLLVVKQMNREFKVKDPLLIHWNTLANKLRTKVSCTISHVRREYNTYADALANKALDEKIMPDAEFEALWRSGIPRSYWPTTPSSKQPIQTSIF